MFILVIGNKIIFSYKNNYYSLSFNDSSVCLGTVGKQKGDEVPWEISQAYNELAERYKYKSMTEKLVVDMALYIKDRAEKIFFERNLSYNERECRFFYPK